MEIGLLIAYGALGIMAVAPIYYGSFASVKWSKKSKSGHTVQKVDSDSSEDETTSDPLTTEDAYLFPIFGSAVLFSLYLVFKLLDKEYVNYLVTAYFAFLGVVAVTDAGAIQMLSLDSFKTGMILLSGLFFYDIFWVFGTEVMVTVAKSFDAPIKVVWPKRWFGLQPDEALQFTMLGLGDIVIPGRFLSLNIDSNTENVGLMGTISRLGIYVALCLRFDHSNYLKNNPNARRHSRFPTPYFNNCFAAYILGLATTIIVMHTFKAAQPALLYLSPACILSVLITGILKNQLKEVFGYSAESADKKDDGKKTEDVPKQASSESEGDEGSPKKRVIEENDKNGDSSALLTAEDEDYVEVSATGVKNKKNKKKPSKKKTG
ncbi:10630_t:CDS:2 [Acaulospora colombiana]|uniref:10630_t:CDS:1 n=1 Tax=Acaulospora colombiana TaxID=27376 RepID=A0ACA9KH70_9GLOM|nr:10630_t:CDS:2 [Acaulospora colombiana]